MAKKGSKSGGVSAAGRKLVMNCSFGKPSPIKSDDGVDHVRISVKIPQADLDAVSADELFVWQKLKVSFGIVKPSDFQSESLPEVEGNQIYTQTVEVSGFKRSRTHYTVSFIMSTDYIDVDDALDLWGHDGSIHVTSMGTPDAKEEDKPDSNQKSLID